MRASPLPAYRRSLSIFRNRHPTAWRFRNRSVAVQTAVHLLFVLPIRTFRKERASRCRASNLDAGYFVCDCNELRQRACGLRRRQVEQVPAASVLSSILPDSDLRNKQKRCNESDRIGLFQGPGQYSDDPSPQPRTPPVRIASPNLRLQVNVNAELLKRRTDAVTGHKPCKRRRNRRPLTRIQVENCQSASESMAHMQRLTVATPVLIDANI